MHLPFDFHQIFRKGVLKVNKQLLKWRDLQRKSHDKILKIPWGIPPPTLVRPRVKSVWWSISNWVSYPWSILRNWVISSCSLLRLDNMVGNCSPAKIYCDLSHKIIPCSKRITPITISSSTVIERIWHRQIWQIEQEEEQQLQSNSI